MRASYNNEGVAAASANLLLTFIERVPLSVSVPRVLIFPKTSTT